MKAPVPRFWPALSAWFFLIALTSAAVPATPPYFFADFEADAHWSLGPLPVEDSALRLMQGKAEIAAAPETQSQQVLALGPSSNYPAVFFDASPFASSSVVFCEILAKPFAMEETSDEEFLDFDGAVVGCFRVGSQGEIRGLYAKSPQENVWISTGLRFDLGADGLPSKWLRITIRLDRGSHTWSVAINGVPAIAALRTVSLRAASTLPLWLYGDPKHLTFFDDLLISATAPDELEKLLSLPARTLAATPQRPGQQLVTQTKPTPELRRAQASMTKLDRPAPSTPSLTLRGWHLGLDTGRQKIEKPMPLHEAKSDPAIIAYAPGYDDEGRPLPAVITITADAELRPGVDLSRLRWQVAELKGWPDKIGEIAGHGDFRTGLVQRFTLTPEWARRATRVAVWMEAASAVNAP